MKNKNIFNNLKNNIKYVKKSNVKNLEHKKYDDRTYKINYKALLKMISGNRKITKNWVNKRLEITMDDIVPVLKKRFKTYKSPANNKQFSTVYNSDLIFKNKLMELISTFVENDKLDEIEILLKKGKSDKVIMQFIKKNKHASYVKGFRKYKNVKIAEKIRKYTKDWTKKPKILDIGAGSGKKIKEIQQLLNSEIYGTDIPEWGPYSKNKKFNYPFKYIKMDPYIVPFKSNYFDCIFMSLILHHASNIGEVLDECHRLLKKNGIVVIIEHDVWNDYDNMIINLQHRIYSYAYNETPVEKGSYYNFYEWDLIFSEHDFTPIFGDHIFSDFQGTHSRYDNQFIGIYQKN